MPMPIPTPKAARGESGLDVDLVNGGSSEDVGVAVGCDACVERVVDVCS